ncbi:ABC transporter ATP-binding protein [Microlunatus ginsengisoli]|uniref:ABC transporter ATP-binding protein n=2 Tax=Microlunatus ginsengisoli TaxID=363863 RepID=A0ABP6ZSA0_9ACTN
MTDMTAAAEPSTTYAVEALGLRKTYRTRGGRQVAVADLDLRVPAGGVHGFLGPNGSGKTTTIRMLLGLISADSGRMRVFDTEVPHHLPSVVDRIGAIVEQPKFFPAFSGKKNLELLAQAIGAGSGQVGRVLDEVGLTERARSKYRTYSLGMKQRLAIAATLLKDPELLIFDEPTNGLDPAGIHEIRATMRGLADRGKTVLVSSHILSEVQLVADTVTIIGRGRLLAEGPVAELLSRGAPASFRVVVAEPGRAAAVLTAGGLAVEPSPDQSLMVRPAPAGPGLPPTPFDPARITEALAREGLYVRELVPIRPDLEQVFLSLTAEEHLGAHSTAPIAYGPPPGPGQGGAR